ncbi:MAG: hypothetical protein HY257_05890 [Chloroflexi bacterium]|nr:hypothetical protein [Chloroflexota bacterium]
MKDAVGGITTLQALDFLARDAQTETIVLISKPPSPNVAAKIFDAARRTNKNIVVDFIGYESENADDGNLHFAKTCDHAARLAVSYLGVAPGAISAVSKEIGKRAARLEQELAMMLVDSRVPRASNAPQAAPAQKYLRGLYSGGTLAYEAQFYLRDYLGAIFSNAPLAANSHDLYRKPAQKLLSSNLSKEHAIIDLGAEEFMVGRLHPMIDNDLRIRRLKQEADDPTVALILLDVVLGDGAHPDPARELAPAISDAIARAAKAGRDLQVVAVVIGTENDPQNYESQVKQLYQAGANLYATHETALQMIGMMLGSSSESKVPSPESKVAPEIGHWTQDIELEKFAPVDSMTLSKPFAAINVGIESFYDSLRAQNASAIHVDWKPPAGGNEKLMAILERLKG